MFLPLSSEEFEKWFFLRQLCNSCC
jgi:hypothetical protein